MTSILVVEDEAVVAMDIQVRLTKAGYQVCGTADTGEKAIRRALERKPDLVLMDVSLKGDIDGIQTAERLRALLDVPVVFLTAYTDEDILRRAKGTEPFGYVVKPFDDRDLRVAIEIGVHRHRLTVQLREANEQLQREILERRRVEDALRVSQERYEAAVRGANDGIWDWDLTTNRLYTSPRWKDMLGLADHEMGSLLSDWLDRVHPEDRDHLAVELAAHVEGSTSHFECEYRMQHRDGSYRWMLCRGLATRHGREHPTRMAGSQTDITARKRAEEQLLHDAFHDALTGLPNRALFVDRLSIAMERARRRSDYLFAVLFLDFDRFKSVNDGLGHSVGDQLLVAAADRLSSVIRASDTVARFGGDEFVFLLEDLESPEDACAAAGRIQARLREPFMLAEHEVHLSASVGVVVNQEGNNDYQRSDEVLRDADIAMYRAKSLGRARCQLFEPGMRSAAMARLQLECDLRRAVERGQLVLHYQPVISLVTGQIVGFEALVRWQHPTLGLVMPAEFIPVAEETGAISDIGDYVLLEACRQLRRWQQQLPCNPPLFVSVNLSAAQFGLRDLPERIRRALAETGVSGGSLHLEITETALMSDTEVTAGTMSQLKALGVRIDVDDFGTGYSSLAYLKRLPIDSLKIDQYFVSKLDADTCNGEIVRTIIALAQSLSVDVVGEGVETNQQLERLKAMNCGYGQGYFLGRPVDVDTASELLEHHLSGSSMAV